MTPLVIDDDVRAEIARIAKNAEANPTPLETMEKLASGDSAPGGLNKEFTIWIPVGFSVTYTHEVQPGNVVCRHMSMSAGDNNKVPHPEAFKMMMELFGFVNTLDDLIEMGSIWEEAFSGDTCLAINAVEPLDGNFDSLMRKK